MESGKTICEIRNDEQLRNAFIDKYKNFILSAASKVLGHYVGTDDDEYSLAMIAFNDAITKYDESKGDFYKFATLLIRNKLIDDLRKQNSNVIPFSSLHPAGKDFEDEDLEAVGDKDVASDIAIELHILKAELAKYNISMFDIPQSSPKALKTKQMTYDILMYISKNAEAKKSILKNKEIPLKLLMDSFGVNRKLLERHRKYIIAATIILNGDYPIISEYIKNLREVRK